MLLAQRTLGVNSLKELLALAKSREANPLSFASVGKGSAHHFCMELLKCEAKMPLLHVPYRGVAPAVLAVTRGEVDLYCSDIHRSADLAARRQGAAARHHQPQAAPALPNIPPFAEDRAAELRADRLRRHHGDRRHAART